MRLVYIIQARLVCFVVKHFSNTFSRENRASFKYEKPKKCVVIAREELQQKHSRTFDPEWILSTRIFFVFFSEIAGIFHSFPRIHRIFFCIFCIARPICWTDGSFAAELSYRLMK